MILRVASMTLLLRYIHTITAYHFTPVASWLLTILEFFYLVKVLEKFFAVNDQMVGEVYLQINTQVLISWWVGENRVDNCELYCFKVLIFKEICFYDVIYFYFSFLFSDHYMQFTFSNQTNIFSSLYMCFAFRNEALD